MLPQIIRQRKSSETKHGSKGRGNRRFHDFLRFLTTALALAPWTIWAGKNISILDFEIKSDALRMVTREDAQSLAGRVRKVAIDYDTSWNLMDRETIERHLADNGKSYAECMSQAENRCQTIVAQLIGTQLHVSGDISYSAGELVLTMRFYDVENNKALAQEDVRGKDVKGLSKSVEDAAQKMFKRLPSTSAGLASDIGANSDVLIAPFAPGESAYSASLRSADDGKGELFVSTSEPGANLFVDGKLIDGITPLQLVDLPAGKHKIAASKGDLVGFATVELKVGELRKQMIELVPGVGTLKIGSTPLGARVLLDGKQDLGTTPLRENQISAGPHTLVYRYPGYWPKTQNIRITANRTTSATVELQPTGSVLFQSAESNSGQALRIRGAVDTGFVLGSGPIDLPAGQYLATIENPRFLEWKDSFSVVAGKSIRRDAPILLRVGKAHLESSPVSQIWKDGRDLGATPSTMIDLDPGAASFVLRAAGYEDSVVVLPIASGRTVEANIRLKHNRAWIDSALHAERSARMRSWRLVLGPVAATALIGAIYFHLEAVSEAGKADDASSAYDAATSDFESYKSKQRQAARASASNLTKAWILDSVAGVVASAFTLTYAF